MKAVLRLLLCTISVLLLSCTSSRDMLDTFFEEHSTLERNDLVSWIEKSEVKVPVIREDFDEYRDLPNSFFSVGHEVLGYTGTWELHLLRRIDEKAVVYTVVIPVYRRSVVSQESFVDHFGEHIDSQPSLLSALLGRVSLIPVNTYKYPMIECRVSDDYGYYGLFDTVCGLSYVITLAEYRIK